MLTANSNFASIKLQTITSACSWNHATKTAFNRVIYVHKDDLETM